MNSALKFRIPTRIFLVATLCFVLVQCESRQEISWRNVINSAVELYEKGQYFEGLEVAEEALTLAEKNFGADHPNVATSAWLLSKFYITQRKYIEAENICRRALIVAEKVSDEAQVGIILDGLAEICLRQGKYTDAEALSRRALTILVKNYGPDNQVVGVAADNLAEIYKMQEKYKEALLLYRRALEIIEKNLGPNHNRVASVMFDMAECYKKLGKEYEARILTENALEIYFK